MYIFSGCLNGCLGTAKANAYKLRYQSDGRLPPPVLPVPRQRQSRSNGFPDQPKQPTQPPCRFQNNDAQAA